MSRWLNIAENAGSVRVKQLGTVHDSDFREGRCQIAEYASATKCPAGVCPPLQNVTLDLPRPCRRRCQFGVQPVSNPNIESLPTRDIRSSGAMGALPNHPLLPVDCTVVQRNSSRYPSRCKSPADLDARGTGHRVGVAAAIGLPAGSTSRSRRPLHLAHWVPRRRASSSSDSGFNSGWR